MNFLKSSSFDLLIVASYELQIFGHFLACPQNFGFSSFGSLIDAFSFCQLYFTLCCCFLTNFSKPANTDFTSTSNSFLLITISSISLSLFQISIISSSMVSTAFIFLFLRFDNLTLIFLLLLLCYIQQTYWKLPLSTIFLFWAFYSRHLSLINFVEPNILFPRSR